MLFKCTICKKRKPSSGFYDWSGLRCKECVRVVRNRWRKNNPNKMKAQRERWRNREGNIEKKRIRNRRWRKAQPGRHRNCRITKKQYDDMLYSQNGVCVICGEPETTYRWGRIIALAIDHNHETGEIRGLLCTKCNSGLGCFRDNANILASAISYLNQKTPA